MFAQTYRVRAVPAVILMLALFAPALGLHAEQREPTLTVVDRSMTHDGLYQCTIHMPKDYPADTIVLALYDRKKTKCGETSMATIPTPTGKICFFVLNHELVKHSVVHLHTYPLGDDRHKQLKFVVGDRHAVRKEGSKTIEVPIE
jgi:hypothetical protein